jgi:hypothetical protein
VAEAYCQGNEGDYAPLYSAKLYNEWIASHTRILLSGMVPRNEGCFTSTFGEEEKEENCIYLTYEQSNISFSSGSTKPISIYLIYHFHLVVQSQFQYILRT